MKTDIVKGLISLGLGVLIVVPGASQRMGSTTKPDVTVKNSYVGDEGVAIDIIGVAVVTPDDVKCWDYDGKLSPTLTEQLKARLLRSNGNELSFKYGKKNRFVLFKSKNPNTYPEWRTETGDYVSGMSFYDGGGDNLQGFRVATDPDVKELSILTTITNPTPKKIDVPFKQGGKFTLFDADYELGSIQPYKAPESTTNRAVYSERRLSSASKYWSIIFKVSTTAQPNYMGGTFTVIGADKQPILYVDRLGNPVSAVVYLSDPEPENPGYYDGMPRTEDKTKKPHKYVKATFYSQQSIAGAASYVTNVDPSKVTSLQVSYSERKVVKFENIPLDPKD